MTSFEKRGFAAEIRSRAAALKAMPRPLEILPLSADTSLKPLPKAHSLNRSARAPMCWRLLIMIRAGFWRAPVRERSAYPKIAGVWPSILTYRIKAGRDVLALAERGDLGGTSFGFTALDEQRDGDRRELRAVDLHEISVMLAWPAYDGTIIQARSLSQASPFRTYSERALRLLELSK